MIVEADTILSPAKLAVVQERSPAVHAVQRDHHAKRLMKSQKTALVFIPENRRTNLEKMVSRPSI